ncbi:hypothetical protein [Enterobacter bugandensis]|uniref:hypothetical protein n=1 Tax=Enterobacter bugandensis TaxID=881260 RepID=UPI0012383109|nr:hypothetical protein [Enterobacter bugandensis]
MNLKDLSATTILLAILYFTAYSFFRGYGDFYGFPSAFISVGVAELVRFSVIATGIMFSLVALLHLDTDGDAIPLRWGALFALFATIFVFVTFYIMGGSGYLFEKNTRSLFGQSFLLGVFSVIGVRHLSLFVKSGFKFKSKYNAVMVIGVITFLPGSLGWAWAYLPFEPMYYSKENKSYILANYSGNFILGSCLKEHAKYSVVDKLSGDITPVTTKETQEIKTCFLKAAKTSIPRY